MKEEKFANLPCRTDCQFLGRRTPKTIRPCVIQLIKNETYCEDKIKDLYSSRGYKDVILSLERKRILVLSPDGSQIGYVVNGSAAMPKTQS